MLGVLQPGFRPVYEYLFCGSPDQAKSMGTGTPCKNQWIQNTAGTAHLAYSPLSLKILMIFVTIFSVTFPVTHGTDAIIPGNPIFLCSNVSLNFFWSHDSQIFSEDNSCHYRSLPDSVLRVLGAIRFYFSRYALNIE